MSDPRRLTLDLASAAVQRQARLVVGRATRVAMTEGGASIALEPANPSYEVRILPPNRVRIQGKMVGLYRRY